MFEYIYFFFSFKKRREVEREGKRGLVILFIISFLFVLNGYVNMSKEVI